MNEKEIMEMIASVGMASQQAGTGDAVDETLAWLSSRNRRRRMTGRMVWAVSTLFVAAMLIPLFVGLLPTPMCSYILGDNMTHSVEVCTDILNTMSKIQ